MQLGMIGGVGGGENNWDLGMGKDGDDSLERYMGIWGGGNQGINQSPIFSSSPTSMEPK